MNQRRDFARVIVGLTLLLIPILTFGEFKVENETRSNLSINFENPSWEIKQEMIGANAYDYVNSESLTVTVDVGSPELPFYSATIEIPHSGNATINVRVIKSTQLENINIKPFRENEDELLTFDNQVYSKNLLYPSEIVQIGEPAIFRNKRVVSFVIHPFRYNDALNILEIIEKANIEISFDNTPSVNEITRSKMKPSQEFEEFFASTILNYQAPITRDEYQNPTILYIYPDIIDEAGGSDSLEELFAWRREQGWTVHTANTTATGNTSATIKAYIQNAYDNWEEPPAFVTFIGHTTGYVSIPTHHGNHNSVGDHYYGLLEGDDELEDIFLGRLSVSDTFCLDTVVAKIIAYEKATTDDPTYLDKVLLTSQTAGSGQSAVITNQYVKEVMQNYNTDFEFTEYHGVDPEPALFTVALNNGVGLWNFRGRSTISGWIAGGVNSLYNYGKLPIMLFLTSSSSLHLGSIAQTVVTAGSPNYLIGAVSSVGMGTDYTHTAFNNCLNGGIIAHLFAEGGWTMGGAVGRGRHFLWQAYNSSKPDKVVLYSAYCNMIGDSSLRVYKGLPKTISARHLENIPAGTNQIKVSTSETGQALSDAWVTLKVGDDYISGYTNANGAIYLDIPLATTGQGKLTISKEGYRPVQRELNFGLELPNINAGEITIISDGVEVDYLTPNAAFELKIDANNVSDSDISSVTATISSSANGVTVTPNSVAYGEVPNNSSVTSSEAFQLTMANHAYDRYVPIKVTFLANAYFCEREVMVPIKSPVIQVSDFTIANPNFGPGETSTLTVELSNEGTGRINLGNATLSSADNRITINLGEAAIGALEVDAFTTITFNISASIDFMPGSLAPLIIDIEDSGFETECYFSVTIGEASVTDPLGADAYGYYIFDSYDIGYEEFPFYRWIELNPDSGGAGVQVDLPDGGDNQEQVQTVELPFDFKFYGKDYDEISICSNGWIALGETQQATHRNWRLPGPLGPSPMIAAFWDDLCTGLHGKVWTAYDQAENCFIITWNNWRCFYVPGFEQTFQVILYDPIHHESSTGDGPIKIQYKVINNLNHQVGTDHGQYATVGIEDHTGTVGLEYTYNNEYPAAARPLQNELALYITAKTAQLPPYVIAQPDDITFEEDHVDSSINLYSIFRDPNNDDLIFTFSESENLSFEANEFEASEEGYLVITPAQDWFGQETVTVYASDGICETVASVSFLVTVTPVNDPPVLKDKFPKETNFSSDTNVIYFKVDVYDVDSEITYEWEVNELILEGEISDSLYYVFKTIDTHSIKCYASDEDFTVIASWNVNVTTDNIVEPVLMNTLSQNAPNPFNPSTTINFSLKKSSNVSLVVYNLKGQRVKTLVSEEVQQGAHSIVWNGLDDKNKPVSSGVYFYRLITDEYRSTKKAIMMK